MAYLMSDLHREALQSNRPELVENIVDLRRVLDHLLAAKVITKSLMDRIIQSTTVEEDRTRELLNILPTRGPHAFDIFLAALDATENTYVASCLRDWVDRNGSSSGSAGGPAAGGLAAAPAAVAAAPAAPAAAAAAAHSDTTDNSPNKDKALLDLIVNGKPELDVEVEKAALSQRKKGYYEMKNERCFGRVLIVNNEKVDAKEERTGSSTDVINLYELFRKLNFDVAIEKNLNAEEMREILKREAEHPDHEEADMFVLVVMSHGVKNHILTKDGKEISGEEITGYFTADECKALKNNPKLFFFVACQAGEATAVPVSNDGGEDEVDCTRPELGRAHMYEAWSVVGGAKSQRCVEKGTYFVRALVVVFMKHAHDTSLQDMMEMVNRLMMDNPNTVGGDRFMAQVCIEQKTLGGKVFFLP